MANLKGKVVIITGASSGFGAESAKLFAKEGCKVVLCARRLDRLEELAREIRSAGGDALPVEMDVTRLEQIDSMIQKTIDTYGRIDILFNNAGFGRLDWLESLDPIKDIQMQINVDLLGVIWTARAVLPQMYKQRSGHIINMCSVAGFAAPPLYTIYSAAKFGMRGFSEALRREAIHFGVRISVIYPGGASTEFQSHMGDNEAKKRFKTPDWLKLTARDVAYSVVGVAKRPRRMIVTPRWQSLSVFFNSHFNAISDKVQAKAFATYHQKQD